jgi:hypothetical protein
VHLQTFSLRQHFVARILVLGQQLKCPEAGSPYHADLAVHTYLNKSGKK